MNKITRNLKKNLIFYNEKKIYNIEEAVDILKKYNYLKFNASINIYINLKKNKNNFYNLKKTIFLPYGNGKNNKLLILIEKKFRDKIKKNGIEYIGGIEYINKIKKNKRNIIFNYIISSKKYMNNLLDIASILGKKKLIPNYDNFTIVDKINYLKIIKYYKDSRNLLIESDKYGIIHLMIGKTNFNKEKIIKNYNYIIDIIKDINIKNKFILIKSIFINTTMSPSLRLYI